MIFPFALSVLLICRTIRARLPRSGIRRLKLLECGSRDQFPIATLVPWTARVRLASVSDAGGIVEVLIHQSGRRRNAAYREGRLAEAFERRSESLHVGNFPRHEE